MGIILVDGRAAKGSCTSSKGGGGGGGEDSGSSRPEMRGPPDVDNLLNQLSSKNVGDSRNINLN